MMISYHRHFRKAFQKLPKKIQVQVEEKILLFIRNPFHPDLNNHKLVGEYKGHRSIDITGNYRALYLPISDDHAYFKIVGTHHQLYGS